MSIRISLNADDFETLVSGGVVKQDGVEIILKDIGHWNMAAAIGRQVKELPHT